INYQTNNNSIFYTIEQEVFTAIENHADISSCQSTVGVNTIQEPFNMIYPNPTNGLVSVEIQNHTIENIKLYDFQGRLIKETSESQFDISNYSNGKYFIRAQTDKGFYSFKLIKY
ncbi:MAG: T9SS type A sorting domain-containing protein, partial [Ignavibacteria bacterium]|nr:T9SS type A sorting domain-containing protein [Ignavibacteria bacterium]